MRVKDLIVRERPRERLLEFGASALSDAELLAIVLRTGMSGEGVVDFSSRLLQIFGLNGLLHARPEELLLVKGVGDAKACQISALAELNRRVNKEHRPTKIRNREEAYAYCQPLIGHLEQEHFLVVWLDVRNRVIGHEIVTKGLVDSSLVHAREVFRGAIKANACSVIVAHNHPSGDEVPSPEDKRVTEVLIENGELLGVKVLDHLVITKDKYSPVKA